MAGVSRLVVDLARSVRIACRAAIRNSITEHRTIAELAIIRDARVFLRVLAEAEHGIDRLRGANLGLSRSCAPAGNTKVGCAATVCYRITGCRYGGHAVFELDGSSIGLRQDCPLGL